MRLPLQYTGVMRYSFPFQLPSARTTKLIKASQLYDRRSNIGRGSEFSIKLSQGNARIPIGPFDIIVGDTCRCICIGDSCLCNEGCE